MGIVGDGLAVRFGALRLVEIHLRGSLAINRRERFVEREEWAQHPSYFVGGVAADSAIYEVLQAP